MKQWEQWEWEIIRREEKNHGSGEKARWERCNQNERQRGKMEEK